MCRREECSQDAAYRCSWLWQVLSWAGGAGECFPPPLFSCPSLAVDTEPGAMPCAQHGIYRALYMAWLVLAGDHPGALMLSLRVFLQCFQPRGRKTQVTSSSVQPPAPRLGFSYLSVTGERYSRMEAKGKTSSPCLLPGQSCTWLQSFWISIFQEEPTHPSCSALCSPSAQGRVLLLALTGRKRWEAAGSRLLPQMYHL